MNPFQMCSPPTIFPSFFEEKAVVCGETFDCFFAFTWWDGAFWSANRRHSMFEPDRWPDAPDDYSSQIVLTRWSENGDKLEREHEEVLGPGNDPRICLRGGRPVVLYRGAFNSSSETVLHDVASGRRRAISLADPWLAAHGKNWTPFEEAGRLRAIYGFDPLRILEIDPATGLATTVLEQQHGAVPRAAHDGFAMLRGGSNPLEMDGVLTGFGHATLSPWRHTPFQWARAATGDFEVLFPPDFEAIRNAGFGIIDPTSLVTLPDGRLFLGLCCSQRDWFFPQRFVDALVPVEIIRSAGLPPRLCIDTSRFAALPPTRCFPAVELATALPHTEVAYGGRRFEEGEGFACFGPYERLAPGHYRVEFLYRSDAPADTVAGWIDLGACIPGQARSLVRDDLAGTHGETATAVLEAEVSLAENERYELRCHSAGIAPLTLFDVRITRTGPLSAS